MRNGITQRAQKPEGFSNPPLIPDIRIADENVRKKFRDEISDLMEQAHGSVMNSHYDDVVKEKWNNIIMKYKKN